MAASPTRRRERRATILDVARACFLVEGYAATSMSTIAACLGGSKGTLYNYFKNKEDLFAAMMQRECGELQAVMFAASTREQSPEALLTHFARGFLEQLTSPQSIAIHRLVVAESERFPEIGRVFYENGPRVVMARVGTLLQELMEQGRLRRDDPLVAAQQFKGLVMSAAYWERLWGVGSELTSQEMDRHVDQAVHTFLRAYAPDPEG